MRSEERGRDSRVRRGMLWLCSRGGQARSKTSDERYARAGRRSADCLPISRSKADATTDASAGAWREGEMGDVQTQTSVVFQGLRTPLGAGSSSTHAAYAWSTAVVPFFVWRPSCDEGGAIAAPKAGGAAVRRKTRGGGCVTHCERGRVRAASPALHRLDIVPERDKAPAVQFRSLSTWRGR